MDPNRRTTSLPIGMSIRILSTISRGGNIYGIEAEEVSKYTGIDVANHALISDWASINDAHFYAEKTSRFSLERAAHEAAALGVPRVVLFRILDKVVDPPPMKLKELEIEKTKKRKTPAKKKSEKA